MCGPSIMATITAIGGVCCAGELDSTTLKWLAYGLLYPVVFPVHNLYTAIQVIRGKYKYKVIRIINNVAGKVDEDDKDENSMMKLFEILGNH